MIIIQICSHVFASVISGMKLLLQLLCLVHAVNYATAACPRSWTYEGCWTDQSNRAIRNWLLGQTAGHVEFSRSRHLTHLSSDIGRMSSRRSCGRIRRHWSASRRSLRTKISSAFLLTQFLQFADRLRDSQYWKYGPASNC